jgi:hypothetical protein
LEYRALNSKGTFVAARYVAVASSILFTGQIYKQDSPADGMCFLLKGNVEAKIQGEQRQNLNDDYRQKLIRSYGHCTYQCDEFIFKS